MKRLVTDWKSNNPNLFSTKFSFTI